MWLQWFHNSPFLLQFNFSFDGRLLWRCYYSSFIHYLLSHLSLPLGEVNNTSFSTKKKKNWGGLGCCKSIYKYFKISFFSMSIFRVELYPIEITGVYCPRSLLRWQFTFCSLVYKKLCQRHPQYVLEFTCLLRTNQIYCICSIFVPEDIFV